MSSELEIKTSRLIEIAERNRLGGILINSQHNFPWLTGGGDNGIDKSRENGAASLFVRRDGTRYLISNNIESSRMIAEEISADDFEPVTFSWTDEKADGSLAATTAVKLADNEKIGSDIAFGAAAQVVEPDIAKARIDLTEAEIERISKLGSDAGKAFNDVFAELQPGMTESGAAELLRSKLAGHGITSVVTLAAADQRIRRFRHPVPKDNRWQKLLLLVTCAKRNGLIVSLSRLISAGDADGETVDRLAANALINASIYDATMAGATGAEIYEAAAAAYEKVGYASEIDNHHQGGCAGYKTREWVAHPKSNNVVKNDQAFAWNPSITGVKVEETIVLQDDEVKVITATPGFAAIETEINGKLYSSPGILSL